jgi:hypothetical protein
MRPVFMFQPIIQFIGSHINFAHDSHSINVVLFLIILTIAAAK